MKISLREILKESWKQTKANWKTLVPFFLVVFIVSFALSLRGGDILSLSGLVSILVTPVVYYAMTKVSVLVSKNEKVDFNQLFKGLTQKVYLQFLAVSLIVSVFLALVTGLNVILMNTDIFLGSIVSLALFVFLFVYFVGVIFFPYYRLIDEGADFWTAIKDSFGLAAGNRVFLVKFAIFTLLLNMLGAMILGVGLLVTVPLTLISIAHIYSKLKIKN